MQYIQSNKFTDNTLSIYTSMPFERSTITATNLLIYMMKNKTETYDSKQKFISALNLAYGMKLYFGLSSYGDDLMLSMRVQYIRQDLVEDTNYMSRVVDLIDQALFHSVFDMNNFEEAKYLLKTKLQRMLDDPDSLAVYSTFLNMDTDHKISIPVQGFLEDLDTISLEEILDVYKTFRGLEKHVYFCGLMDPLMKSYLESIDVNRELISHHTLLQDTLYKEHIIQKDISQSSLCLVYETNIDIFSSSYYALYLMNCILGQSPSSLLFNEVREKKSLCYSVQSSLIRFDGVLMIYCGTSKENLEYALQVIDQQIDRLCHMDYEDTLLEIAKKDCIDSLIAASDQPFSLISQWFLDSLLHRSMTREDKIEAIQAVTKEDIQRVSQQLRKVSCVIVEEKEYEI